MNRSALHGGPPRGPSSAALRGPIIGSQTPVHNPSNYKSSDAQPSFGHPLHYSSSPGYGSQDARGGGIFAVQPAVAPIKINLKKAAVKVVSPANLPVQDLPALATPTNIAAPVVAKPIAEDEYV
jgi:hypothetical protein